MNGCCPLVQCCPVTGDASPPPDVTKEAADSRGQQTDAAKEPQPGARSRLSNDRPEDRQPLVVDGVPHDRRRVRPQLGQNEESTETQKESADRPQTRDDVRPQACDDVRPQVRGDIRPRVRIEPSPHVEDE